MNKTISLSAIAMFAVIMGMGAIAPAALASPNDEHNPKNNAVCHFDTDTNDDGDLTVDDRAWIVKLVNKHALNAHQGHGDLLVPSQITEAECLAQPDPEPLV